MTNTHRKTTNRTTAKIAAVGAFGIGAAIAFPGVAAAQDTPDTGSLEALTEDGGSLEGALGTDIGADLGSLAFNLNLDAETPTPGSVDFGSLGISPNTGSEVVDSGSGAADGGTGEGTGSLSTGSAGDDNAADDGTGEATGSLSGGSAGDDNAADGGTETGSAAGSAEGATGSAEGEGATGETGSLDLAGLSSGVEAGAGADVEAGVGSLG